MPYACWPRWLAPRLRSGDTTARPVTTALPNVEVTDGAEGQATGSGQYTAREVSLGKLVQSPRETPQSISVITRQQLGDQRDQGGGRRQAQHRRH